MGRTSALNDARLASALASGGYSNEVVYKLALSNLRRHGAARILDFGAGVGQFTQILRSVFPEADVSGVDIMERPPTLAGSVNWRQGDLNNQIPFEDNSFDLVFSLEVIEHLENPRHFFRELFRLLSPGGELIVTTPNIVCLRSLISVAFKGCFALFDDSNYPAHITPQSPLDLERAAAEAGFADPCIFFTDVGTLPKFVAWDWQDLPLVGGAFKGRLFSDNVGASFIRPETVV